MKNVKNIYVSSPGGADGEFVPLLADDQDEQPVLLDTGETLPILALRNIVLFPGIVIPVSIGRPKSLRLVREMYRKSKYLGAVTQRDKNVEDPTPSDLFQTGTVAQIVRILEMPDNSTTVILQGKTPFTTVEFTQETPYMRATVNLVEENNKTPRGSVFKGLMAAIKDLASRMTRLSGDMPQEINFALRNIEEARYFVNFVSANMGLPLEVKQRLLEADSLEARATLLLQALTEQEQLLEIRNSIQNQAKESIDKQQREYFLQQQMKTIQKELGGSTRDQDLERLRAKAATRKWSDETRLLVEKELDRLAALPQQSGDYSVQATYAQTLVDLPWNEYTKDNFNLKRAKRILDRDHYGLDDVKERVIEHLAVLKLKGDMKSPILCLYGPPGVGKTSLGKSIAEALGRKYVHMSLGGLHDEAEIRGHRRTYIGAMPGRVIQNLMKAESSNPVFILDEIDKVGDDFKGDPASALLEVLDPEQNSAFQDNYLGIDYDLSKVMFVATANALDTISRPLLDRMEIIHISGYVQEEKTEIAIRHLLPRQLENHGLQPEAFSLPKKTAAAIIEGYTRESGVRGLDKQIARIARKVARKVAMGETYNPVISPDDLEEYLGTRVFTRDDTSADGETGVVTGLAWTQAGGEILQIETSVCKGKGRLSLTGNLGDVMKESATLGMEYIKSHAADFGVGDDFFETRDLLLHVPEGAIPKDGPSAGITMATSMLSAITGRRPRGRMAMTGELTLHGKVLPVGGIKEKMLAARRAGVTDILLCRDNRKDIDDIKPLYLKGLTFHYVSDVKEVFDFALLP